MDDRVDAWTLAWRAAIAAVKLIPTTQPVPITADLTGYVREDGATPGRTLQDDIDDKIVQRDELFWDKGTIIRRYRS